MAIAPKKLDLSRIFSNQEVKGASVKVLEVSSVTSDSRELQPQCVFVAIQGGKTDGHDFIPQAFAAGASLVVGETAPPGGGGPYLQVSDSRLALAQLAAAFHGNPSHGMLMIGVTGTSGKTTSTYILESILAAAGKRPGVIGTVNFRFGGKVIPSTHTTPGPVELQALLAQMRDEGCDAVVMEVSSHALKQARTAAIAFDGMVFTNLTPEHLDFHPDLADYFAAKARLFTDYVAVAIAAGKRPVLSINLDDPYGRKLFEVSAPQAASGAKREGFTLKAVGALHSGLEGVSFGAGAVSVRSSLVGAFNASNILGAVTVARGLGISPDAVSRGVSALTAVPGRLELVRAAEKSGVRVMVDYAHKSDALEKVLETLREMVPRGHGRLITVFGCGGDRDRSKRPIMGAIAARLSDQVIVTSDNPRTEDPAKIIQEIMAGVQSSQVRVEPDRRKAIEQAIENSRAGDLILIAGKGHEDYQILGTTKIHFNDKEIASEALTRVFKSL